MTPTPQQLLPYAEADARRSRNTILGVIGVPLTVLGLLGTVMMTGVGMSGGSGGSELFLLLAIFTVVLFCGIAAVVYSLRRFRRDPACTALRRDAKVIDIQYSSVLQFPRRLKIANYTLDSGGTYSCIVPNEFPDESQVPTAF